MMKSFHLYAGIGAHALGFHRAGIQPMGFCEIDPFCQAVLRKHWPDKPVHDDVRTLTVDFVRGCCGGAPDVLEGGFMCTDLSVGGKGKGIGRETRSGITWREMFRLIRGLRPDWLVIENVPALRGRGADRLLAALERIGYACWPVVVGAVHVGANFVGQRVWIVAASGGAGLQAGRKVSSSAEPVQSVPAGGGSYRRVAGSKQPQFLWEEPRLVESPLGMSVDGPERRLARYRSTNSIRALGNANPPQIIEMIGRWLTLREGLVSA